VRAGDDESVPCAATSDDDGGEGGRRGEARDDAASVRANGAARSMAGLHRLPRCGFEGE
jgi:hypothetical protein